jgi:signal transduction histidine kinase
MAAPRHSISRKILAVKLASTLVALLLAIAAMVVYDLRLYYQGWINDLTTQAELLGQMTAPALSFDDAKVARENLALLRYRPRILAAAIYDARGRLFATYPQEATGGFPRLPEGDGARLESGELVVFKRIVNEREILGTVYLRAQYALFDRLLGYLGIAAIVTVLAMAVAWLFSRWVHRVLVRPVLAITRLATEITEKRNFALRAEKLTSDEIGLLAESFNAMLAEIERATRELEASNRESAREVTERRRAEQEILRLNAELETRVNQRTTELQSTNAELEAFCYSVSHDLRAPLRSIDGFSQALLEDFPSDVPEEARRYLARIRSSTQRMGQLIEDLLNLSKVSRGDLQRRDIDIGELARQVAAELQQREPARKVEVSVWDGMQANADPRLLRAALENLIGNAWKFSAKAEHARVEIGCLRDGEQASFFVRDNGAGFDMRYADKLFGAFQRLHSASEFQGTGIGLATVQRIVHRHGGRIWADAAPGKGAVFFFTLAPGRVQALEAAKKEVAA